MVLTVTFNCNSPLHLLEYCSRILSDLSVLVESYGNAFKVQRKLLTQSLKEPFKIRIDCCKYKTHHK